MRGTLSDVEAFAKLETINSIVVHTSCSTQGRAFLRSIDRTMRSISYSRTCLVRSTVTCMILLLTLNLIMKSLFEYDDRVSQFVMCQILLS